MGEAEFQKKYGHKSTCFCVRLWHGRYLITPRRCDCGYGGVTRERAFNQAEEEIGKLTAGNHTAIVARVQELEGGDG